MDREKFLTGLYPLIGGKTNTSLCDFQDGTLYVTLKDAGLADETAVAKLPDVASAMLRRGRLTITFGTSEQKEEVSFMANKISDPSALAKTILEKVGGKENVDSLTHCLTRLRFTLKDDSKVQINALKSVSGVISVIQAGGQTQVVIGPKVANVFNEIMPMLSLSSKEDTPSSKKSQKIMDQVFSMFSALFTPFVPVLAGSGVLRGLLTLAVSFGFIDKATGTYTVLWAIADVVLYFLPFYLAVTSARYFKVNEFLGLTVAGALLYPSILTAYTDGTALNFLGIPITMIKYTSSVVPIIISVFVLSLLDRAIRSRIPATIRSFAVPFIDLVVMIPLTLIAIGPIFTFLTNLITDIFMAIYGFSPIILGLIIGAMWQPLVIFGLHRGFIPINLNNLATLGQDPLLAMTMPSVFAQTGAALGVALRAKDKEFKSIATSNVLPGFLGITEPIVYGVTLKAKKTFYYACIMAGIGGAIIAGAGCYAIALPSGGLLATAVFSEHNLIWYVVACAVSFVGTFTMTLLFGFDVSSQAE